MKTLRSWVAPVTTGSFLLVGVTGLLMFLRIRGSLIVVAHEWLSPIFLVGAGLHVWLNWHAVRLHLSRARGLVVVGLFVGLLALSLVPFDAAVEMVREHGHGQEAANSRAAEILLGARIATVAELTKRTPRQLRDRLSRRGIRVDSDDVTLADAARESRVHPVHALDAVLQDE
jgi:hypothetical protein